MIDSDRASFGSAISCYVYRALRAIDPVRHQGPFESRSMNHCRAHSLRSSAIGSSESAAARTVSGLARRSVNWFLILVGPPDPVQNLLHPLRGVMGHVPPRLEPSLICAFPGSPNGV